MYSDMSSSISITISDLINTNKYMSVLSLPDWVKPHFYEGVKFNGLSEDQVSDLKRRLSKFSHEEPDVSIMIPSWNEENNIFRTLSSLASSTTSLKVEIVVINNNSTDNTQVILDQLNVRSYFQPLQGIPYARQMGLEKARGKYHLCADSDTFYPPRWIDEMVRPMIQQKDIVGVYGRYAFIPPPGVRRVNLYAYEKVAGMLVRIRKYRREHINVLGFSMGFVTDIGRKTGGFKVTNVRMFDNAIGSEYYVEEAEDGRMALNLKTVGKLKLITSSKARVFTSPRRLSAEGGVLTAFKNRIKLHTSRITEYLNGGKVEA
jgi:glycosyltransferase involved in cell wall biosynthesis